jgi:oligosaccharide repeat unit polymerase
MNRMLADRRSAPFVGVAAAVLATVIATVAFFPDQPGPRGALVVPALIMTIGLLVVPALRLFSGSDETTNAENFVMVGLVFWLLLDLLQGAYDLRQASNNALRDALASIGVTAAAVWIGLLGRPWKAPGWLVEVTGRPLEARTITRLVPICFVLGMFNFAYSVDFDIPEMFSYLGASRWAAPWSRAQLGGWNAFIDQMPYFGYVLPSLTALLIVKRGLLRPSTFIAIGCSAIMLLFLAQGGGRRLIGVTVGAALLVWVQAQPGMRFKNMVIVGVGAIALAWASQFILNIRSGGLDEFLERGSGYDYLHVDDNFLRLAQVIDIVPAQHPYVGTGMVVYAAVRPIPRVFWPSKPVDAGFDLAQQVGLKGVSLSMSIIGEWYLSWGWAAVIFGGWLHGRLAKAANTLREQGIASRNPIVYGLAVMVLIAGMRSMLDLIIMSYALVAWWAVNRLLSPSPDARHAAAYR